MKIEMIKDKKGQACIHWEQAPGIYKRAWIQRKDPSDSKKNWAQVPDGRYLNVVRLNDKGNPGGNATDFLIFDNKNDDEKISRDFVALINSLTGTFNSIVSN